jgi:hypothetical protein
MKRLFQIAALTVIALLAAQPALSGELCAMGVLNGESEAHCPGMAMSQMGMHCPMHSPSASMGCDKGSCRDCLLTSVVQFAPGDKQKTVRTRCVAAPPSFFQGGGTALAAAPPSTLDAATPDRCILFQVFRI